MHILAILWLIGMTAMFAYMLISYIRIRQKMRTATKIQENVYESELAETPFVLGILQPRIYLPYAAREADRRYILAHETAHIRHCDHVMKPFAFALLAVYWFHPLIWLAFILFCRDLEFACDERVIRTLNVTERANYSQALLACSLPQKKISVCPLAFSEHDTKNRIRSVLQYQRPAFWLILLVLVLCIAAAVCLLSDPKTDGKQDRSGEVVLAEADVDDDGAEETLSYQKLGDESDGPVYLLHITKSDGTELWPEEAYLSESHAGWIAYFLYRDDEGYAILDYSPWSGQGFASYSYKLYRFEGSERKIAQEGSVDFAMPKNAEDTWPKEAAAFADEVNALLDHSTLLISTIGGQLRTGEDASLWKCGPETANGPLPANTDSCLYESGFTLYPGRTAKLRLYGTRDESTEIYHIREIKFFWDNGDVTTLSTVDAVLDYWDDDETAPQETEAWEQDGGLVIGDFNFDGYTDIGLQVQTSAYNAPYVYWFYHPEDTGSETFAYAGWYVCPLEIDEKTQTCTVSYRDGQEYHEDAYKPDGKGNLQLVKQETIRPE